MFKQDKKAVWHSSEEVSKNFYGLNHKLGRLLLLESLWDKTTAGRARFWVISAVKGGTVFVKVQSSAAKQELMFKKKDLIKELNKNFDSPWIKEISII